MGPTSAPFRHFPERPARPTPELVKAHCRELREAATRAEQGAGPEGWIALIGQWNSLKAYLRGESARIHYRLSRDMTDAGAEADERFFREEIDPIHDAMSFELVTKLLATRHRAGIEARYGGYWLERLGASRETTHPSNTELRIKTGELVTDYDKLVASGEVTVGGSSVTLSVARGLQTSEDPVIRREAFESSRRWFLDHREKLGGIFGELVGARHQMALGLGHRNFVQLGYAGMDRTDYGPAEAERFRDGIRQYAVPVLRRLREAQARELGTPTLLPWDAAFTPSLELPTGVCPVEGQLDHAEHVFDRLSPRLGEHFRRMRREGLIDLENRRGKRAGAFCTSFPDEERVAIFCNSVGQAEDVSTLTHEMGHAFQSWESQAIELVDLRLPTLDACEIHSMGMEYLALRHAREFFPGEKGEDLARRFRVRRWKSSIDLICYVAVVDEFQHWVYGNPSATADERDRAWDRSWDVYQPGIDFRGVEPYRYSRWYAQGHLFHAPFYYIDYAIAETGAMQLALLDARDPAQAISSYLELCRVGGTRSLLGIFKDAGMRSPFEPELMRDLMKHAERQLG